MGDDAPTVEFDHSTTVRVEGGSAEGGVSFTLYDQDGHIYTEKTDGFQCPQEPGTYLVCEECFWGTGRQNFGLEYFFWFEVTQEYLDSHQSGE